MTFGFSFPSNTSSNQPLKAQRLARVSEPIIPLWDGLVFFEGTYWQARFHDPSCQTMVYPGEKVEVIARESLTLLVMPIGLTPFPLTQPEPSPEALSQTFQINQWVQWLNSCPITR